MVGKETVAMEMCEHLNGHTFGFDPWSETQYLVT